MDNATQALANVVYDALYAKACKKVERDYRKHYGKTLLVTHVYGCSVSYDAHIDRLLDPPVRMRVSTTPITMLHERIRDQTDDWIDPQWYVEPLEKNAQLAKMGLLRVYGISRNIATELEEVYGWTLFEEQP